MIYGNINYPNLYDFLAEKFLLCLDFIKQNDLASMELKTYELDGDKVFCTLQEYETVPAETKQFEAHKNYIDVHYIVEGKESIEVGFTDDMKAGEYKPDIMFLDGEGKGSVILEEGDFLICFPEDAHKPGVSVKDASKMRKALFKVIV